MTWPFQGSACLFACLADNQIFKGFHRFLQARKAVQIEAAFGVRLVCPVDEFYASRHVGDDFPAQLTSITRP
ncbi:hypothetical protein GCM10010371_53600 [Streptomyces subrutilus]|uniref:Uncharacterized protein n=1 Tax=Streptomyces subrutilus TaxID=36818 RepID=A0A918R5R9_9ACTN|nr:hypothetical protein [Streptomyces subrutilus]GGZ86892.1 hypothetical protein GCM10010371_53600 [Streptomyces subrutilus]